MWRSWAAARSACGSRPNCTAGECARSCWSGAPANNAWIARSDPHSGHSQPVSAWNGHEVLTPREADVLDQLQLGRSNGEIAAALSVSVETVRTHARSVFRKLGVHSRRELAR